MPWSESTGVFSEGFPRRLFRSVRSPHIEFADAGYKSLHTSELQDFRSRGDASSATMINEIADCSIVRQPWPIAKVPAYPTVKTRCSC